MVVGGSQQETLDPGFVLLGTRQQDVPVILRELMLPGGFDLNVNRVLLNRMKDSVDAQLRDQQARFRKDRSCTNQIVTLQIIVEQSIEWNASLYINFIDYEKSFDSVYITTLWKLLRYCDVPQKILNIIENSYDGLNCEIVHGGQLTGSFEENARLSDTTQHAPNKSHLTGIWKMLKPTHIWAASLNEKSGSYADVKARIGKARAAYLQLRNIWNPMQLSTNTKVTIFNTNVKTVLLYGVGTCRTTKAIIQKIEVFINSCLCKILRIRLPRHYQQQPTLVEKKSGSRGGRNQDEVLEVDRTQDKPSHGILKAK
ncbi:unnamed protein product [Schistosoma curassoni]|uniref:Reverse transcriptase domain-containing protein n=1 Tax=Schistosoma curassoni TaxID=6186 RepID=A0A183K7B5_9TREM|nr:unnamed protein product [Schistosoma curassoni]